VVFRSFRVLLDCVGTRVPVDSGVDIAAAALLLILVYVEMYGTCWVFFSLRW
jgi:hypothetical protein